MIFMVQGCKNIIATYMLMMSSPASSLISAIQDLQIALMLEKSV